jgi:hypothetical protein
MADVEEMKCRHCGWTIKPIYPMAPEAGYVHVAYGDEPNYQFCKGQGMNAAEPFKLPADASPSEPQDSLAHPDASLAANGAGGLRFDLQKTVEIIAAPGAVKALHGASYRAAPTAAGSEEPKFGEFFTCWAKADIPGRPDFVGVRTRSDGRREFLTHNNAMCYPYYLTVEGEAAPVASSHGVITNGKIGSISDLVTYPVASQAPARPTGKFMAGRETWKQAEAYMDYLEGRIRELEASAKR